MRAWIGGERRRMCREEALESAAISVGDLGEDRIFSAAGLAKTLGMSLSPVRGR